VMESPSGMTLTVLVTRGGLVLVVLLGATLLGATLLGATLRVVVVVVVLVGALVGALEPPDGGPDGGGTAVTVGVEPSPLAWTAAP